MTPRSPRREGGVMGAVTKRLWAPIIKPARGHEWVNWLCVRSTKREAIIAYRAGVPIECMRHHIRRVRFARVTITEEPPK